MEKITIERICRKLKFVNFFVVPRVNQGGGLALLWRENINLVVLTSSDRHIDASIDFGMDDAWCLRISMVTLKLPTGNIPGLY